MNLVLLSDIFGMGKSIKTTWISIWLSLNNAVYSVVEVLYKVFMSVAEVNLFSREAFEKITGRVYVVIGIAMLFIFAYNLILMIINPDDKKGTGQMTKLVKETIITLVLIVLLPTIFNYMSVFQKHILDSNIIGQIIMGGVGGASKQDCEKYSTYDVLTTNGIDSSKVNSLKDVCTGYNSLDSKYKGASSIPSTLFSAFFHPSSYGYYECADYVVKCSGKSYAACQTSRVSTEDDAEICAHYYYDVELSKFKGSLTPFDDTLFIDKVVDSNDDSFEFNYLLAFVSGCFALYMFACYTLAIGVRVAKLGFLQILSPVASMMRIIPKKKEAIFDKWLKNVIDTYLDVFIRLAIIYFALFAISLVPDVIDTLLTSFESLYTVKLLSIVVVILGILKFAQEAPKLLKEFFGEGGSFALKSPKKQFQENKLANGIIGATGTLANRAVNYAGNYKRIFDDNKLSRSEKAWNAVKNTGGMLNPFSIYNSARTGYDYTKEGKDRLQGINKATAESLTKPGFWYRARRKGSETMAQLSHYASTDYTNLQADKINLEIKTLDDLLKQKEAIFKVLGSDKNINNVTSYYDRVIDEANKRNDFNEAARLAKEKKDTIKQLRDAIAYEKKTGREATIQQLADGTFRVGNKNTVDSSKIDAQFTTAIDNFNKQLTENFSTIKDVLKETNTTLSDINGNTIETLDDIKDGINNNNNMDFVDKIGKASERQRAADKNIINSINELKQGKSDK